MSERLCLHSLACHEPGLPKVGMRGLVATRRGASAQAAGVAQPSAGAGRCPHAHAPRAGPSLPPSPPRACAVPLWQELGVAAKQRAEAATERAAKAEVRKERAKKKAARLHARGPTTVVMVRPQLAAAGGERSRGGRAKEGGRSDRVALPSPPAGSFP
jgi:hypothetical protein